MRRARGGREVRGFELGSWGLFDCWHRGRTGGGGTLGDVTHLSGCSRWQSGSHRTREPEWIGSGRPSADARGRVEGAHAGRRWPRGFENTGNYFTAHLGELHLAHEAHAEVLEDDAVGGGEEARTWEMKCFSSSVRLSQCFVSSERSTPRLRDGGEAGRGGTTVKWHPSDAPKTSRARREARAGFGATASKLGCRDVPVRRRPRPSCTSPRCPRT